MTNDPIRYWGIIPAAGVGRRMGAAIPKQYLTLCGRKVLDYSLQALLSHPSISGVVIGLSPQDQWWPTISATGNKPLWTVEGGAERCQTVHRALQKLTPQAGPGDWVLVHDAVRPCLHRQDLDNLITVLSDDPVGGLLAMPARDTMKQVDDQQRVLATVDRRQLWHALTPQMFRLKQLMDALEAALASRQWVTDEASAMEGQGFVPRLVEGRTDNIKITVPRDLALAEFYLDRQDRENLL